MSTINKEIPIQQAEWEKFSKTVDTFEQFKAELAINHISDIFTDTKIKQDKEKYIFNINDENKFAINGKVNFLNRTQRFYKELWEKEHRKAEEQVLIRINGLKVEYIKTTTKEELDLLKPEITKVENSIEKTTDIEIAKYKIERLTAFFKQEKDIAKDETSGRIFNKK